MISPYGCAASLPASRPPDLFARPPACPLERDVLVARRGRFRRPHLDQVFDLEAVTAQYANPVPVREVKLDAGIARPLDSPHSEGGAEQTLGGGARLRGDTEGEEVRIREEEQLAAGSQDARRLGDPAIGIRPEAGAIFRDRQIECPGTTGDALGVRFDQREVEAVLALESARGRELRGRCVEADDLAAAAGEPRRDIRGAAPGPG